MPRRLPAIVVAVLVAVLALPAVANADLMHFTTPSKDIDCIADFDEAFVDCLVQRASWPTLPPEPASCDNDWIPTEISLLRGRVSVGSCRGDIGPLCVQTTGDCPALRYGTSLTLPSGVRCTSRRAGLTCRMRQGTGRGFTVSRQGYRIVG